MACRLVSHPGVRRKTRPGEGFPPLPCPCPASSHDVGLAAVVFPGQVAGSCAARHPHHGELLGVARAGARVAAGACVLPQHGICGPQLPRSGLSLRGGDNRPNGVETIGGEACPLPSAGLAQSLYCWGLHTGAPPGGGGQLQGGLPGPGPLPIRPLFGFPAPYPACASFGSRISEPRSGSHRSGDSPLDYREAWGLEWGWGSPGSQRVPAQSQGPEMRSCSRPRAVAGSSAVEGLVKDASREVEHPGTVNSCWEIEASGTLRKSLGWGAVGVKVVWSEGGGLEVQGRILAAAGRTQKSGNQGVPQSPAGQ